MSEAEVEMLILLFEIGIVIISSLVVAKVLGSRGIPQVLGLILGGIALQFFSFITSFPTPPTPELHYIITTVALGFIGYSIGAHLDIRKLRDSPYGLALILIGEAIGSFLVVTFFLTIFLQDFLLATLLGTIAMATAPASTAAVLNEYKSYGSLTQTILFVIAFDDILAIIFFNITLSLTESAFLGNTLSLIEILVPVVIEIGGSIVLGVVLALIMKNFNLEGIETYRSAEFVFPMVLICVSLAGIFHFSIILSCIIFGLILSTMAQCENKECVLGVERLSSPILALFFILVGFEMNLALLLTPILLIIVVYVISRAFGKSIGSYTTSRVSRMPKKVYNNLPFALFTQAGVALGLAAFAYARLIAINIPEATDAAVLVLDVIAVSVLIAEIIGPLLLKFALMRSGEVQKAPT
ncbi:MAG: cation:proton antiporter [Candidatus Hodarchaeales archaeon]|jgi:Kef-type K+ transport system membrane component KefB